MLSKLPKWVEIGAFILALVAGYVNANGLLGVEQLSVSHLTGSATLLGINLLSHSYQVVFYLLGIILSFLAGASIAGFLLHGSTLELGRHYDTALCVEALLLLLSCWLLSAGWFYGYFFVSMACGLQNALATTYSGAIVRTTHVTGIFTDLGIMLGAVFRGQVLDKRKLILFLYIILGFIVGSAVGAWCYQQYQFSALYIPAITCFLMAITYRVYINSRI